jgi:hypothetical protein
MVFTALVRSALAQGIKTQGGNEQYRMEKSRQEAAELELGHELIYTKAEIDAICTGDRQQLKPLFYALFSITENTYNKANGKWNKDDSKVHNGKAKHKPPKPGKKPKKK